MPAIGCQTCAVLLKIAPEYRDPSIICPECRGRTAIPAATLGNLGTPMKNMARRDDDDDDDDRRPRKQGSGAAAAGMSIGIILAIVGGVLVVCMCVPMIAVGLLMVPAVQKVREAAARTQSVNNLKNIGLSFHGFHDANKRLPFNGSGQQVNNVNYSLTAVGGNLNSGSWGFQILPYIDQAPTFQTANRNVGVPAYMCPGRGRPLMDTGGGAWTDYFLNGYINSPKSKPDDADRKVTMVGITDGTSNTVFVGHGNISTADYAKPNNVTGSSNVFVGGTIGTMRAGGECKADGSSPAGVTLQRDSEKTPGIGSWGGPFPQGGLMAMGDATVRMFPYSTQNFGAFLTPTGREEVRLPD